MEAGQCGPNGASVPLHVVMVRKNEAGHVLTPLPLDQVVRVQGWLVNQEHVFLIFAQVRIA